MNKVWKVVLLLALSCLALGVALITVSVLTGGSINRIKNNISFESYTAEFEAADIDALNISVSAGMLNIVQSDYFRVEANDISKEYFECRVENGTLIIRDKWEQSFAVNVFRGINFGSYEPTITLYIPASFKAGRALINVAAGRCSIDGLEADDIELAMSAGEIMAVDIRAQHLNVNMSAGGCRIDSLVANESAMQVSAGELTVNGLQAGSYRLDVAAGAAYVRGAVDGYGSFNCGIGMMSIELEGDRSDYNVGVDVGLGSIYLDGERISGSVLQKDTAVGGADIELQCGVGEIQVAFTGADISNWKP